MGISMKESKLKALITELAKDIKSEQDLSSLTQDLIKLTVETALNAELDDHLGYEKNSISGIGTGNSRNGSSPERLKGQHGEVEIDNPRDRAGTFEPQFVQKNQTRLTQMDDQILTLYAKGLSTRDIVATFQEMYGANISPTLVSKVTERVLDEVIEWQSRPLDTESPRVDRRHYCLSQAALLNSVC